MVHGISVTGTNYVISYQARRSTKQTDRMLVLVREERKAGGQPLAKILAADLGVFALSRVLRNPTILEAGRIRPIVSSLCLPRPHYPAIRRLLIRDNLEVDTP